MCRNRITLHRYVTVFIVPHMDIELEDNKQFISNTPRKHIIALPFITKHYTPGSGPRVGIRGQKLGNTHFKFSWQSFFF